MPYHNYDELISLFGSLGIHSEVIGQSVLGRDLHVFILGNANAKSIYYQGSIHGNEHPGAELLYLYANWLVNSKDPMALDIVANSQIMMVPAANPDGFEAFTRINANGVDLNRNFPKGWGGAGSNPGTGCTVCRGNGAADQPEVQAILSCWNKYQPSIGVDIHTGAEVIAYPWCCWTEPISNKAIYGGIYYAYKQLALERGVELYLFGQSSLSSVPRDLVEPKTISSFPYSIYVDCGDSIDTMQDRGMLGFTLEATKEFDPPYDDLVTKYFPRLLPFVITCNQSVYTSITPAEPPPSPPSVLAPSISSFLIFGGAGLSLILFYLLTRRS